ncbi:dockerin type I domain-containing protein [Ruminococcus flavefaciens]|uniref:dockerin type I domain-containing protein n=1 Tax=Ruminococcus flavefaciens TaxID=1265 RepID=UPI0002EBCBD6|nr:dockerin type I domain-containing protein [Ruminococcus flavefaciens]
MRFNKIAALLMASVMTAGAASAMTASAKEYYVKVMKCDINGNGRIDTDDRQKVLDHINGKALPRNRITTADVNWDGKVDILDVSEISNKLHDGDVSDNGMIDSNDLDRVLKHINGIKPLKGDEFTTANVNGDKKVDIEDYNLIKKRLGKAAGFRRGNVLNDNYITTDDTDAVLKHIQGKKALSKDAFIRADVNKDNKVDIVDYRKILEYISNK